MGLACQQCQTKKEETLLTLGLAATELTLLPPLYINRMVRAKAKMSYQDNGDENGAGSEGESYQGGDSEEEFSDASPAKKKKTSAKKKMKKAKKEKKKSKHTDDSDEDDIVAEVRFIHLFLPHMSQSLPPVKNYRFLLSKIVHDTYDTLLGFCLENEEEELWL